MRIRIALTAAAAATFIPVSIFTLFSSTSASGDTRHVSAEHRVVTRTTLQAQRAAQARQAAQAQQAAQLAAYANAVTAAQTAKYIQTLAFLQDLAFFHAVAQQQAATAAAHAAVATPVALPTPAAGGGSDATSVDTPHWACIRQHESGGNYAEGGGGAYQFEFGTWHGLTGLPAPAQDYPAAVQDAAALKLFSQRGWEPWTTRYVCGL